MGTAKINAPVNLMGAFSLINTFGLQINCSDKRSHTAYTTMVMLEYSLQALIRTAKMPDAESLERIHRESWRNAYCGIIPHEQLQKMIDRRSISWWRRAIHSGDSILVLEAVGKIAGYATLGRARCQSAQQGEIYELYLDPVYQGLGFGEMLFEACRANLDGRRLRGLIIWVLADNAAALEFYKKRGGRQSANSFENIGGSRLEKIALTWS